MEGSERELSATYSSQQLITPPTDSQPLSDEVLDSHQRNMTQTTTIPRAHKITVCVLCFINLINYMDRFTIAGVLSDLQTEFNIDDSRAGLLQTVFIISYMIFAPIFGYLGDRHSRKIIMGYGITLWSLTTLIGSFMPNYYIFLVLRGMVGIGEASYSTIAPTIISDLFVKDVRSKCLAVFYFAIPVGSGLGYIVGSRLALAFDSWRFALRLTPILGALAVVSLFFSVEPERGESEGSHNLQTTSYTDDVKSLCKNRSFMLSTAGFTCVAFVAGALSWWGPTYMFLGIKTIDKNVSLNDVSLTFGIAAMIAGIVGVALGSCLSQTLRQKYPNCDPIICGSGLLMSAPLIYCAIVIADVSSIGTIFCVFLAQVSLNITWPLVADMVLYVVKPTRRATAEAFQILISHALGDAGSPYIVGIISDAIKRNAWTSETQSEGVQSFLIKNENFTISALSLNPTNMTELSMDHDEISFKALQYALFSTCFVEVLGAVFFLITAGYILRDKKNAEAIAPDENVSTPSQSISANPTIYSYD